MVGGEDDAHVVGVVAFCHFLGEAFGIGGGGVAELVGEGLDDVFVFVALFPDLDIGADGEGMERGGAFLGPLGEGLGEEIQAGDEEEDALVFPGDFLGDLEAGEGFAGAAGHDELATVGRCEAGGDFALGAGLVEAEFLLGLEGGGGGGAGAVFCPVDLAGFEGEEVDLVNGWLLAVEGVGGIIGPVVSGGDDVAEGERFLAGGGEEAVDIGLFHGVVLGVAFALDGVVFLGAVRFRDEVDAGVFARHAELRGADFPGSVGVEPDVGVEVGVGGLVAEIGADEFLEVAAFFPLSLGGGAVGGEEALERSHEKSESYGIV